MLTLTFILNKLYYFSCHLPGRVLHGSKLWTLQKHVTGSIWNVDLLSHDENLTDVTDSKWGDVRCSQDKQRTRGHVENQREMMVRSHVVTRLSGEDTTGRNIRCLSGVWSGTTLHRTSVQLSKSSDTTYSARPVGQPGHGRRLPQPGQLMIGDDLLSYHHNNNNNNNRKIRKTERKW